MELLEKKKEIRAYIYSDFKKCFHVGKTSIKFFLAKHCALKFACLFITVGLYYSAEICIKIIINLVIDR